MKRTLLSLLAAVAGFAALAIAPATATAQTANATVYVVHGIPGVTVDVYVNGKATLAGFKPGTVAGPLSLPSAEYTIDVRKAGDPATATPLFSAKATPPAGANVSLVAHLDANGTPEITPYANDVTCPPTGQGRLVVRHDAAAPAVDVLAGGKAVITNLSNPNEKALELPAGTVNASVVPTGMTSPVVIGPAPVPVTAGNVTIVYAVGSLSAKSLTVVTQSLTAACTTSAPTTAAPTTAAAPVTTMAGPTVIRTGNSGLAAQGGSTPVLPYAAVAMIAIAGVAFAAHSLRRNES